MQLQEQIISVIHTTLKSANFVKKREGVAPYLVVLHFVYMEEFTQEVDTCRWDIE